MKKSLLALSLSVGFAANANDAQWHTITTDHFKVHYQQAYQAWATSAANELEIVRDKVLEQQSRSLDKPVDVLVFDPINAANGFAIPPSNQPLMALYATPPQSDTVISNSSGWQQLLVLHEYIHLVHLAQPTRSEWRQKLRDIWGIYDLSHASMPRWAAEGYATLLESQMTGRGRLHDNYVEALISQFAKEGALPTYGQLGDDSGGFMAGSMAYLVGVRYLQWLEDEYGKESLDAVWTRMQAVEQRDFNEAFKGAFGASAKKLYRRFVAEYTYKAMSQEADQDELKTKLWQDLDYVVQSPVLSPSEEKLALVRRDKKGNVKLFVYSTQDNTKAQQEFEKAQAEIKQADPNDITDKAPKVFKREQKTLLNAIDTKGIVNPKWLDENTLIFGAFSVANNELNTRHQDLFKWNSETGEVTQLTQFANLRRFTLAENGIAYAEQAKHGFSELVKVDLTSGEITPITEKSLATVYDFPELHGDQLAYLKTGLNENWALWIKDLNTQETLQVAMPKGYQYLSYPKWSPQGDSIYYVAGVDGATNLYRYTFATDQLDQMSFGQQVVSYPMPSNNHGLLYLATNSEGPDVYALGEDAQVVAVTERETSLFANIDKAQAHSLPPAKIHTASIGKTDVYDPLEQHATFSLGEQYNSASTALLQLGVKGNDFLRRFNWQLGGAIDSQNALSGAFAELSYYTGDIKLLAHGFDYELHGNKQYKGAQALDLDIDRKGLFVSATYPYRQNQFTVNSEIAYLYSDDKQTGHSEWVRVGFDQAWQRDWQAFAIGQSVKAQYYDGRSHHLTWDGFDIEARIFGKLWSMPLYAQYQNRERNDSSMLLGGFASSVIKEQVHGDMILAQELPFASISVEDYQSYQMGFAIKETAPWLYYQEHQVDDIDYAKSYGLKWQLPISIGLGPAVANDLQVSLGLVKVEGDTITDETRGWLGLWYSL